MYSTPEIIGHLASQRHQELIRKSRVIAAVRGAHLQNGEQVGSARFWVWAHLQLDHMTYQMPTILSLEPAPFTLLQQLMHEVFQLWRS
jgi:hypothetical protein